MQHAGCFGLLKKRSMLESVFILQSVQTIFQRKKTIWTWFFSSCPFIYTWTMSFRFYFSFCFFFSLPGSRSGVLIVKILELHEECTIQVAMCEQLVGLQADGSSPGEAPGTGLKVLFTKETAHYLRGQPQDIIHIYPPWWVPERLPESPTVSLSLKHLWQNVIRNIFVALL